MHPRWLNGDMVIKEPIVAGPNGKRRGIVIGVRRSNESSILPADIYPYVYYVFFHDGKFEGPLFHSQLHDA